MYSFWKLEREDDLALIATHTKSHVAKIEKRNKFVLQHPYSLLIASLKYRFQQSHV